jgi:uncharacterized Zn finger protein (UPF0148 family)
MKVKNEKASAKPPMLTVCGSVVVRCNRCGVFLPEIFKLNGGTVRCPYCKIQYTYQVEVQTN